MAPARLLAASVLRTNLCRQCRRTATQQASYHALSRSAQPVQRAIRPAFTSLRWHSSASSASKVYDFGDIKSLSESPSPERVLIDVREPYEYEEGFIPSAVNIPIKSQPDAMFLPADEFEDKFGFDKPSADKEVIFYCKAGVRSSAAAQLAQQIGYKNVGEYRGSWLDWEKHGGPTSKAS